MCDFSSLEKSTVNGNKLYAFKKFKGTFSGEDLYECFKVFFYTLSKMINDIFL